MLAPRSFSLPLKTGLKLPDISALNGTAVNNVGEFDGLTVYPGINPDAATSGFLFTYSGAAAAYSVRQLNNNAPYVMRVRRVTGTGNAGNDDEADVKFDTTLTDPTISLDSPVDNFSAGGSNATTLGEFLNVGTVNSITYTDADSLSPNTAEAYVDAWYDLTGNQNHAEQSTPASQPQIHSGFVDTDLITDNGKPALDFNSGQTLAPPSAVWDKDDFSSFLVGNAHASDDVFLNFSPDSVSWAIYVVQQKSTTELATRLWLNSAAADIASGTNALNNQLLVSSVADVSLSDLQSFIDGSQITGTTAANGSIGSMTIGASNASASRGLDGTIQELVFFGDAKNSTDRTGIETDINGFFSIY